MALVKHEIFGILAECEKNPSFNPYVEIINLANGEILLDFYIRPKEGLEDVAPTYEKVKEQLKELEEISIITTARESEVIDIFIER